jgi:hypothetical protein
MKKNNPSRNMAIYLLSRDLYWNLFTSSSVASVMADMVDFEYLF